jgi:hypothetical protein
MLFQKGANSFHILPELSIYIVGLGLRRSIGVQSQPPDQQHIQPLSRLSDVLFEQDEDMVKRQG